MSHIPINPPPREVETFDVIWRDWLYFLYEHALEDAVEVQSLTVTDAIKPHVQSVELAHATVVIAATIATSLEHTGLFVLKNTSASGTAAHTLTLTEGTFDGTNTVATTNAPGEYLVVYFDSAGNGIVIVNSGVTLT